MKLKKLAAVILAAVTLALAAALPVSADSIFDIAKNIDSGKKVTKTLKEYESMNYKITPSSKGTATIKLTARTRSAGVIVYDEDGSKVKTDMDVTTGTKTSGGEYVHWDYTAEIIKATVTFDVKAGKTYYIKIISDSNKGNGKFEVSFKYPSEAVEETPLMSVTLKKGDTLQLSANGDGAKWSTSKKSVATVSADGLVKAVKAGKTVITLKCGTKSQKIEIVVE